MPQNEAGKYNRFSSSVERLSQFFPFTCMEIYITSIEYTECNVLGRWIRVGRGGWLREGGFCCLRGSECEVLMGSGVVGERYVRHVFARDFASELHHHAALSSVKGGWRERERKKGKRKKNERKKQ